MILYSSWLNLPLATRHKIADAFGIIKKGSTHVVDNTIQSDGFLIKEVEEALNVDALQKYLGSEETDMKILFDMLAKKVEQPEQPEVTATAPVPAITILPPEEAKKFKREYKKRIKDAKTKKSKPE